ncbi:2-dehydropantoate 2-reductase N-terminal domain-containing protein [Clostridium sp.]|uniref:ketopantoate reductase family protein n=1 Tax=Clostridium sp. TaxID=1506 RepID=UPI00258E1E73|nr:2-dehydropantoate 2-reductase N-terminal domain-containing protein [Clostridium sp.]MDF2505400.1 ketopantoate reductase family protein [Clostridium sp.]
MKILVYGAGVMGSYLASELYNAKHQVTVLARGNRFNFLKDNGIVINHIIQKKKTVSKISITNEYKKNDVYDAVIVAMRRNHIDSILTSLTSNNKCPLYIFIGNNSKIEDVYENFVENSTNSPEVLFGFAKACGKIENDIVESVHENITEIAIGDPLSLDIYWQDEVDKIFKDINFKISYREDIDSWLKHHIAMMSPMTTALQWADGDIKKFTGSTKLLDTTIEAVKEGFLVLKDLGYALEPALTVRLSNILPKILLRMYFKKLALDNLLELKMYNHTRVAAEEMNILTDEFKVIKENSKIKTPALDQLYSYRS